MGAEGELELMSGTEHGEKAEMEAQPGFVEIDALGSLGSTERQQRSRGGGAVTESTRWWCGDREHGLNWMPRKEGWR